jgi:mannose-6-phosphate isomerase-like protein (cupin superfamily)
VTELGPGDWLGLHRHAPSEVYYVFAGAGILSLDGREITVGAGSAVFIPGMAEHGIRQTGSEILRLLYAFPVDSFDGVEYLFSAAPGG